MIVLAENNPDITKGAKSAVMIEYTTGEILYNKNGTYDTKYKNLFGIYRE